MTTWEQHTDNPDAATDERLAAAWREYVARLRAVPVPERTEVAV